MKFILFYQVAIVNWSVCSDNCKKKTKSGTRSKKYKNIVETERCNLLKTIQLNEMGFAATFIAKYNLKERSFG